MLTCTKLTISYARLQQIKDAMNVDLSLKKIDTLELETKNLLIKQFDANELINAVKIKNMPLTEKVRELGTYLNVVREQHSRTSSSKLDNVGIMCP